MAKTAEVMVLKFGVHWRTALGIWVGFWYKDARDEKIRKKRWDGSKFIGDMFFQEETAKLRCEKRPVDIEKKNPECWRDVFFERW